MNKTISLLQLNKWMNPTSDTKNVTGYLHLTRVKSTNSKKYSKGKIQR